MPNTNKETYKDNRIGVKEIPGKRHTGGVGYVIIPPDIDREEYIRQSYNAGTISFSVGINADQYDNIKVTKSVFRDLEFPKESGQFGSQIVWIMIPRKNLPVIIGVITKSGEFLSLVENQFLLSRSTKDGFVEIRGDAKVGKIFMNVESLKDEGGEFILNIRNKAQSGVLKVITDGKVDFDIRDEINVLVGNLLKFKIQNKIEDNETQTEIKYERGVGFFYTDEFENQITINKDNFQLIAKLIKFGEGTEALLLGNLWKSFMDDFIDEIASATVATSLGTQPLLNVIQIKAFKQRTKSILSQLSFTD